MRDESFNSDRDRDDVGTGPEDAITEAYRKQRMDEIRKQKNLHEVGLFYRDLIQFVEECGGEVYPEVQESLDAHEASFHAKADALRVIMVENHARAKRDRAEAAYFAARAQAAEKAADWAEGWIIGGMKAAGLDVAGEKFPQRRQANGGRPSIRWTRTDKLPEDFVRVRVEQDSDAAYAAWKRGELPEGFEVTRGEHLRPVVAPKRKGK